MGRDGDRADSQSGFARRRGGGVGAPSRDSAVGRSGWGGGRRSRG
ncbi:MAG: hypothetical protein AVDCRST_MAG11-423 [uncultured Gemmatimonadaceae bacterium]|uniref:Uncharacterized protein n=1 Tax=uncultured Gemmatimonadaceae bacterium TaxID=246130 RepID=A0A6J4K3W3_9BACT|nr:MAG: hypothetical protein AVDCRST_MAG11-423 [uncultured Gemmatimonadaceae bacterium]